MQGGGASKWAVRAFFSTLRERDAKKGERRPTNVAAGGSPLVSTGEGSEGGGPLADPSAIAAVALEALAAAAASRLGVEASALLSRSSSSASSASSKKVREKDEKKKKADQKEEEKKKTKDSKKKSPSSSSSKSANGKKNKGGKRKKGRVNEGGGYFASSRDIDALGDSTFDSSVLSADSGATMVMF